MNNRVLLIALAALFNQFVSVFSLSAQENKKPDAQPAAQSIQQQIDDLKQGQQRVLDELAEIKKLLQEKPGRVDNAAKPTKPSPISLNVHGELYRGDSRARVAIMEYSDFECSFCARYVREVYPRIDEEYIQSGKVKYFFRDLPEPGQTNALLKARAARCAGEQGQFWEMHDRLFATQSDPAGRNMELQAQALGLDIEKFSACLTSGRYSENIRLSMAGARRAGIYGTPAFLIGTVSDDGDFVLATKLVVGGESFETIKSGLDEMLAAPSKK